MANNLKWLADSATPDYTNKDFGCVWLDPTGTYPNNILLSEWSSLNTGPPRPHPIPPPSPAPDGPGTPNPVYPPPPNPPHPPKPHNFWLYHTEEVEVTNPNDPD